MTVIVMSKDTQIVRAYAHVKNVIVIPRELQQITMSVKHANRRNKMLQYAQQKKRRSWNMLSAARTARKKRARHLRVQSQHQR